VCLRDDDYRAPGKPVCDWQDEAAREALIDALSRDAYAILAALDGEQLTLELSQAAQLLGTVVGQDIEPGESGVFRIVRGVAKNRVISTVDPDARHGHKTAAHGFDGYKGHLAVDPDSEIITATEVTAGNASDGSVAEKLCPEVFEQALAEQESEKESEQNATRESEKESPATEPFAVYGDTAYGTTEFVQKLEGAEIEVYVKVALPSAPAGKFSKAAFEVDLENRTVRCPGGVLVVIKDSSDGGGLAHFGSDCIHCPLRSRCTDGKGGRHLRIHKEEATLQRERQRQQSPTWKASYRATRPKVERKFGHLMQKRHGGRRARMRGTERVGQDFALLGAAHNFKRLAKLGVRHENGVWHR
jgi:hypothetical protein